MVAVLSLVQHYQGGYHSLVYRTGRYKENNMKLYRITNQEGLFIRDDFTFDEETEIGLDVEASQGLYQPKWDFELEQWVEGSSEIPQPQPSEPSLEERLRALEELELERMFEL